MQDVLGTYDVVRRDAEEYSPVFVHRPSPLTRLSFRQLCQYDRSDAGSNKAATEEDTLYAWEIFLLNSEGKQFIHARVLLIKN